MRNLQTLFFFSLMMFSLTASATVYRVNNTGVTGVNVHPTFADAHTAASPGDTIYVEGSASSYGNFTVNKQLTIFGAGYNLSVNTGLQANANPSRTGQVFMDPGSSGSKVAGLQIENYLYLRDSDIVVERNRISRTIFLSDNNAYDVSNTVIRQNFLFNGFNTTGLSYSGGSAPRGNILISNNIFQTPIALTGSGASGVMINNTFHFDFSTWAVNADGFQVINNILGNGLVTLNAGNTFFNNISSATQFPSGNGNQQNVAFVDVVTEDTGIIDNDTYYQTQPGSVAEGAGQLGEDCGAFGGGDPYRLSGIPSIPTIYELVAPSTGTNTINITISTRSNN